MQIAQQGVNENHKTPLITTDIYRLYSNIKIEKNNKDYFENNFSNHKRNILI